MVILIHLDTWCIFVGLPPSGDVILLFLPFFMVTSMSLKDMKTFSLFFASIASHVAGSEDRDPIAF